MVLTAVEEVEEEEELQLVVELSAVEEVLHLVISLLDQVIYLLFLTLSTKAT